MTVGTLAESGDVIPLSLRSAPVELRIEDRLQLLAAPVRRFSKIMAIVLAGSAFAHIVLVVTALVSGWDPPKMPQREITVDLVQDPPKAPPVKPVPAPAEAAKPTEPPAPPLESRKTELPKPPPAKPVPSKAAQRAAPPEPLAAPPKPSDATELEALKKQLESLKAERSVLQSELKSTSPTPDLAAPASGKAIALPSIGAGDGDVVGYQELVFSQLAKAKGDEEYRGRAGVTGVRFEMDAEGRLTGAEVVSSSGNPTLDAKALDIVRRAAPFPPPPRESDRIVFANVNFLPPRR